MSIALSISSSLLATSKGVPATAYSRPGADILTPLAAIISSWYKNSFLTLISFMGCGVRRALTFVTIGPLNPKSTIWSSFFIFPSTKMQSIVVPCPSTIFTSITVQLNLDLETLIRFLMLLMLRLYWTRMESISGSPSPVMPEVGINET